MAFESKVLTGISAAALPTSGLGMAQSRIGRLEKAGGTCFGNALCMGAVDDLLRLWSKLVVARHKALPPNLVWWSVRRTPEPGFVCTALCVRWLHWHGGSSGEWALAGS